MFEPVPRSIPLLELKAQYQTIRDEIRQAVEEVLESQQFILGSGVAGFEEQAASYLNCQATVGVASGSDALLLSLMVLDLGPGCGVLVPTFTFFATASCVARLGATPIFVDVDPATYAISSETIASMLEKDYLKPQDGELVHLRSASRIKALIPVHLFGRACDMQPLVDLAKQYGLFVIEDVAQAMGAFAPSASDPRSRVGTVGDLGCFSFFPTKTLGGIGDGGLIATNRLAWAERLKTLRMHGESSRYHHDWIGINSRLDVIQARVLRVKLKYLDSWCAQRIERANVYHRLFTASGLLGHGINSCPAAGTGQSHVFNYYVIRVEHRDRLKQYLREHSIQSEIYYPVPLHLQPCFSHLGYRRGDFPNAEKIATEVLALPMYPELPLEHQELVVDKIKAFFRS
jgi:dTDP-4-amino-4,6-dideoxygalactose transaminase